MALDGLLNLLSRATGLSSFYVLAVYTVGGLGSVTVFRAWEVDLFRMTAGDWLIDRLRAVVVWSVCC